MKLLKLYRQPSSTLTLMFNTGDEERGNTLSLSLLGFAATVYLPRIVPPHKRKVQARYWDAATIARMGRDWYIEETRREFGLYIFEGNHFVVKYGRQPDCWPGDRSWSCFLPWTSWRFIRTSYYGLAGEHLRTFSGVSRGEFEFKETLPKARFQIRDYDGELITASTHIEEREWRFGDKWCSWLSWFRRPMIKRSLSINFDKEVGPEKGSWKGGTMGTSIEMLPGELHEQAFRRFCDKEHHSKYRAYAVSFLGAVAS